MEDAPTFVENSEVKSECPDIWIRLPNTNGPNHGPVWKIRSLLVEQNLYGHPFGRTVMGKAIRESSIAARLGEGFQLGMLVR